MIHPQISVIIPTYNRAHLLSRAIKSVLDQTFQDFELIIIDDGSTDETEWVAREFKARDQRIFYFYQKHSGEAVARNAGIKKSHGEYIAFLDSDDEWLPEKLEKQIKIFQTSIFFKKLGFVSCHGIVIDEENQAQEKRQSIFYKIPGCRGYILKKTLIPDFFIFPSSVIIKNEVFKKMAFFDENLKFSTDLDMWIRIAEHYFFDFVDEPLFKYHLHGVQMTKAISPAERIKITEYIFEKHKHLYNKYPKIKGAILKHVGALHFLSGDIRNARKYFIISIKINRNLRNILTFLLSFLGRDIYKLVVNIKSRLFS